MAERKRRGSAVLGLLSDEGAAGRLVSPPPLEVAPEPAKPAEAAEVVEAEPAEVVEAAAPASPAVPVAPPGGGVQPVPGVSGEMPEWRASMSPAQYAAQPPPENNRGRYTTDSQTVRAFSHVTQALRMSWLEAKRDNIMLSYTEHASRVIAAGLAAQEEGR